MHAGLRAGSAIALLMGVLSGPAAADMVVYYRAHGWDAFSGPDENGNSVCGIGMTNAADKRSFSIRFQIGSDIVTFRAKKGELEHTVGYVASRDPSNWARHAVEHARCPQRTDR
jgi:hypothetical protein